MTNRTEINGIKYQGEGMYEGNDYAVSFTLYLDAANPEEASMRAMQFRDRVANGGNENPAWKLPFDWHLHDHDGC
jgi:hypothetical protein